MSKIYLLLFSCLFLANTLVQINNAERVGIQGMPLSNEDNEINRRHYSSNEKEDVSNINLENIKVYPNPTKGIISYIVPKEYVGSEIII